MTDKATEALLNELHGKLTQVLIDRISSEGCTAADLAQARQMLRDNGIEASRDHEGLGELGKRMSAADFPVYPDDDDHVGLN